MSLQMLRMGLVGDIVELEPTFCIAIALSLSGKTKRRISDLIVEV